MPSKGDRTRQRVLERAAALFNERGYAAATVGEVMAATGLQKGGVYNHFGTKDDLVLAAYDHNTEVIGHLVRGALAERRHAADRLHAFAAVFRTFVHDPPYPGGCPTLNLTIQSHGIDSRLHERALEVLRSLLDTVARIVARGVERGELEAGTDPAAVAAVVVASIEGALLLSEQLADPGHMDRIAAHLDACIDSLLSEETTS
ncbi:MAG: TetR/AcrR family transcriptional regulator [Acidimicrobiales bacterium]